MRISELSRAGGVPVATIKYYLREGLLPPGERTSATQAAYGETHLRRLGLIRALLGAGGLSVAAARDVVAAIDDPPPAHELLGLVTEAVTPPAGEEPLARARALVERWGWDIDAEDRSGLAGLERALEALDRAGFTPSEELMDRYGRVLGELAAAEVGSVPVDSVEAMVEYAVLGTLLVEPLLIAARRLALQDASAKRFAGS